MDEITDETPAQELELSVRAWNILNSLGVVTVKQLRNITDAELRGRMNVGNKTIDEIRALVPYRPTHGYHWRADRPWSWGLDPVLHTPEMRWAVEHINLIRAVLAGECEIVPK